MIGATRGVSVKRLPVFFLSMPMILALGGCAGPVESEYDRVVGGTDAWAVGATYPRADSLGDCHNDPSVKMAVMSMDMPSSSYVLQLVPESSESDALCLAACLAAARTSNNITISSPVN